MWLVGIIICAGWIFSLCLHEFSHAIVAYWGGDTSVKQKGYLNFNPIEYADSGYTHILHQFENTSVNPSSRVPTRGTPTG